MKKYVAFMCAINVPGQANVRMSEKWLLSDWPLSVPADWVREVNRPQTEAELEGVRRSVHRGQPYGHEAWAKRVALRLGLESTLRARGRPRKQREAPKKL